MHTKFNQQLESIEVVRLTDLQLSDVNGGGLFGAAAKLVGKSIPYIKRAAPVVGHKLVDAAKWTGIPAGIGSGTAWIQHQFTK
jgi:hypothetical protein